MGMDLRHLPRQLAATAAALALVTAPTAASELRASAHQRVAGIVVHDAAETLRDFCRSEDGRLVLELPGGSRWELVTSTDDALITNPGDGRFHPYDAAEVQAAMSDVRFPLAHVSAEVFILPFPRRASLESAAGPGLILLSPGVRALSREHQHSEFVHELGHVVQYAILPDADAAQWSRYAALRGLDLGVYNAQAPHASRPHEIWAEDFRVLFGGASANPSGTIENPDLAYPTQVAGLDTFMESLAAAAAANANQRLTAATRTSGALGFSRFGTRAAVLDVFDAQGRRLASVEPTVGENNVAWMWDGRDRDGRTVASGVVFARARDGQGGTARATILR